ncbi:MAG: metallophosphoesterase [Treponema sp.]|jgi:Icc-related predicted phosphoesterase|nr:metallophosphoesterase [Treponema sp.]
MKILCVSDQIDPLVYSSSIKTRFHDIDMVLCAGDLPLDYLDFIVSSLNRPLLFVFGNHNLESYGRYRRGLKDQRRDSCRGQDTADGSRGSAGLTHAGSRVCTEGGLIIAGLGGSMLYNRGENQYTEGRMFLEMVKIIPRLLINRIFRRRALDILLTHAAPRGIHDRDDPCHRGFKSFLWFMKIFKPRYLIHGHIHLYDLADVRATKYRDTTVINAYSQYLLNTEAFE